MDNLAREMILCEKAGFGVSYGKWKATQPIKEVKKPIEVVEHKYSAIKICLNCGKEFTVFTRHNRKHCSYDCRLAYAEKLKRERRKVM